MIGTPLSRAFAGTSALAALAGAAAWFQLLKRPLPKTAGRLMLRGVGRLGQRARSDRKSVV